MSRTALIAKNTLVQVGGRAVGTVLGLLTLGVMTRYLGTAGYGEFTTVTTFLQFFGIIVDFGLSLTTVAMLSEPGADRDRLASNIFSLRIVSAAIFFAFAPLAILFFPYSAAVKQGVLIGTLSFFFIALNQVLTGVLQKELRMARAAAAEVIGRAGLCVGVIAVAALKLPLGWMIAALVVGNGLTALWNWLLVRKLIDVSWRIDLAVWKSIMGRSWPIGLSIAFNLIYLKGDVIILSLTRSQEEVGLYGSAYKILDVVTVIPIMFMGLVLPLLVKARSDRSSEDWKRIMQKAFDFMALLAMPLVAGTFVVGRDLMRLFAGSAFDPAGEMLRILIIAGAAVFFASLFGHAVIAVDKQRPMIWGYAIDAVLATVAYLLFVPTYGPTAAAWVTVFSEIFIALATFLMIRRATGFAPRFGVTAKAILAAGLMGAFLFFTPSSFHVLLRVLIGALVYLGAIILLGAVPPGQLRGLIPTRIRTESGS